MQAIIGGTPPPAMRNANVSSTLNLVACQSLRSVPRRRSLSLVESILGDPVGPGEKGRPKFSSMSGRPLPPTLEKTENFRRA